MSLRLNIGKNSYTQRLGYKHTLDGGVKIGPEKIRNEREEEGWQVPEWVAQTPRMIMPIMPEPQRPEFEVRFPIGVTTANAGTTITVNDIDFAADDIPF